MTNHRYRLLALLLSAIALSLVAIARSNQTPPSTTSEITSPDTLRAVTTDPDTQAITLNEIAF